MSADAHTCGSLFHETSLDSQKIEYPNTLYRRLIGLFPHNPATQDRDNGDDVEDLLRKELERPAPPTRTKTLQQLRKVYAALKNQPAESYSELPLFHHLKIIIERFGLWDTTTFCHNCNELIGYWRLVHPTGNHHEQGTGGWHRQFGS
ncbi:hypothetical protein RRF57_001328 [Xylaria bambusicola]|uniref:Uncharacterized protein n=1 Tax=Xylaria bambusicola TaxID=326684 RepID=A0AAN7Z1I1_9PEZI